MYSSKRKNVSMPRIKLPAPASAQQIEARILLVRAQKVMIDADLAQLYGVPTKALNQAVKRNNGRFPADFVFQLSKAEKEEVVTNCDHLARLKFSAALKLKELEQRLERRLDSHDQAIAQLMHAIRELMTPPTPEKRPSGFVTPAEKKRRE
jgi:hypothetical protein